MSEVAEFCPWPEAGELEEVTGYLPGDAVGSGLLGGELSGLLEVVQGVADLAAHGVGGGEVDAVAGLPFGGQAGDVDSKIETTKNIYGHLFAWDRAAILDAMNQAVSRLHAYEKPGDQTSEMGA